MPIISNCSCNWEPITKQAHSPKAVYGGMVLWYDDQAFGAVVRWLGYGVAGLRGQNLPATESMPAIQIQGHAWGHASLKVWTQALGHA